MGFSSSVLDSSPNYITDHYLHYVWSLILSNIYIITFIKSAIQFEQGS